MGATLAPIVLKLHAPLEDTAIVYSRKLLYAGCMELILIDFVGGIVAMLLAVKAYVAFHCRWHLRNLLRPPKNSHAQQLAMRPQKISPDWIKSGTPIFLTGRYAESPDQRASSGVWSCEGPATFEWQFDCDETVLILDGRVEIDYLGEKFALEPGGTALFYAGTRAVWHVPQYVRKTYMIHYPNYIVRLARHVFGTLKPRRESKINVKNQWVK